MLADVEIGVTMSDSDDGSLSGSQSGFSHWKREAAPAFNQTELQVVASFGPMTSSIPADFVQGSRGTPASRRPPEFSSLDSLDESTMVTTSMETNITLNLATASGDMAGTNQPSSQETTDEE
jgi:hypothetical protein